MKLSSVFVVLLIMLVVLASSAPSTKKARRKDKSNREHGKKGKGHKDENERLRCHTEAVKVCGKLFIHDYEEEKKENGISYKIKCDLRTTFFDCVKEKKNTTQPCHHPHLHQQHDHKEKKTLQKYLWSTRVCLMDRRITEIS